MEKKTESIELTESNERSYVELFCPRCRETRFVTANMIQLETGT